MVGHSCAEREQILHCIMHPMQRGTGPNPDTPASHDTDFVAGPEAANKHK